MEGTKLVLLVAILSMMKPKEVVARVYGVGDEEEWSSQANYDSWANSYNFSVGDVLVFKYVKGEHNVYEVREEAYRSCDATRGVMGKYESGEDEVELRESRKYWFICNIAGHCLGGMRFGIHVRNHSIDNTAPNAAAAALTPQIQPPPLTSSPNSCPCVHDSHSLLHYSIPIILVQLVIVPFLRL